MQAGGSWYWRQGYILVFCLQMLLIMGRTFSQHQNKAPTVSPRSLFILMKDEQPSLFYDALFLMSIISYLAKSQQSEC